MEAMSRLEKIRAYMDHKNWKYTYREDDGLGTIEFIYRDRAYHIWEFQEDDGSLGAESNVRTCGRMEDYVGDYQQAILDIIEEWLEEERRNAAIEEARDKELMAHLERRINRQW